jgi:hypothetical protein
MAIITGKAPEALTPDEITWICNAALLGIKLIDEGASINKIKTILTDIHNVSSAEPPAPAAVAPAAAAPVASAHVPCSTCLSLLPDVPAYDYCMTHCTG